MITLNKIIMSNEPPLSTDTVWVDVTAKPIIFKLWLKGQWTPIGDEMDEVADILAKIKTINDKDTEQDQEISQLKTDVAGLTTRVETAEAKLIQLDTKDSELSGKITSLQSKVETLEGTVEELKSKVESGAGGVPGA